MNSLSLGLTNFILTVAGVGAVVLLLKGDVKQSASVFKRNVKHIRNWIQEETSAASKAVETKTSKEMDSNGPRKGVSEPKYKD